MAETIPTSETTLQLKRIFPAPREKVFRAWTDPKELKKWFAPTDEYTVPFAEVDLRVGGNYRIAMQAPDGNLHIAIGTYREILPPEKLVFTWSWEGADMQETLVIIEFRKQGNSTEVVLTHKLFPNVEARDKHSQGWTGCLDRLAKVL